MRRFLPLLLLLLCVACTAAPQESSPTLKATSTLPPSPTPASTPTPTLTPSPTPEVKAELSPEPEESREPGEGHTAVRWFGPQWDLVDGYELHEAYFTYQGNGWNVLILYPQLSGQPGDEALSERIRQLALGTDPEVFMGPFDYSEWPNGGTEDGDWQAMRYDDRLFSVLLRNEGYVKGAAHPSSRLLTLTGDRQTGEVLSLEDVVDVGEDLEDWLYAQDWTPLNHRNNSKEELVARCLTDYAARSSHTTDFYLTEEELVLVSWFFPDPTLLSAPLEALSGLREGFL